MSMSFKASPDGTYGEILVNGAVVAKLPVTGNAVIPNLVGTVSESGGVPTGAVVERGSNANGEYVRFADGTQICWVIRIINATVDAGTGVSINKTMAAAFVGEAVYAAKAGLTTEANLSGDVIYALLVSDISGSASYVFNTGRRPTSEHFSYSVGPSTAQSRKEEVIAVGRWF